MSTVPIGSLNSGEAKTPTLRQFLEKNNGKFPLQSNVKIIFNPNEYGSYTFITDHNFRVQLEKGSDTALELQTMLDQFIREETTLVIIPIIEKRVSFEVGASTDCNSEWTVMDWGYKLTLLPPKKKQTGKKNQTSVTSPDGGVEPSP